MLPVLFAQYDGRAATLLAQAGIRPATDSERILKEKIYERYCDSAHI